MPVVEPRLQRGAVGVADEHARHGVLVAQQRVGVERVVDQDEADRALGRDELRLLDPATAAAAAVHTTMLPVNSASWPLSSEAERVADGGGVDDRVAAPREPVTLLPSMSGSGPPLLVRSVSDVAVVAVVGGGADGGEPGGVGRRAGGGRVGAVVAVRGGDEDAGGAGVEEADRVEVVPQLPTATPSRSSS